LVVKFLSGYKIKFEKMNYKLELTIDLPRKRVVELFDSTENLKKWQKGLQSFEAINGIPGEEGAESRLKYKTTKREIVMKETIKRKNLPDEFTAVYEANNVWNEVRNYFKEAGTNKTIWEFETEFKFKGFMKLISFLMPGAFKKESFRSMQAFKEFAESAS